jgi:hypothetical protein
MPDMFSSGHSGNYLTIESGNRVEDITPETADLVLASGEVISEMEESYTYVDFTNNHRRAEVKHCASKMLHEIGSDVMRIRQVLAMLSLSLLRITARSVANTEKHVNGIVYKQWERLSNAYRPTVGLYFKKDRLEKLQSLLNKHSDRVKQAVAMCIRSFIADNPSAAKAQAAARYFLFGPFAFEELHLISALERIKKRTGLDTSRVLEEAKGLAFCGADMFSAYLEYIARGQVDGAKTMRGTPYSTKLYMYSRYLDGNMFLRISRKHLPELYAFLIGFGGGDQKEAEKLIASAEFPQSASFIEMGKNAYNRIVMNEGPVPSDRPERTPKSRKQSTDQETREKSKGECVEDIQHCKLISCEQGA